MWKILLCYYMPIYKNESLWYSGVKHIRYNKTCRIPSLHTGGLILHFIFTLLFSTLWSINPLTPNDHYSGHTTPLTSKRCILYIYSTNTCTEYFKHSIYSLFFPLQNAVCFINLTYLVPVLFTFYIQGVLKLKK